MKSPESSLNTVYYHLPKKQYNVFNHFSSKTNQEQILMLLDNHQQLHRTFLEFYIYHGKIVSKKASSETTLSYIS